MGKTHSTLAGGSAASSETASHARSQYFNAAILRGESPTTETQLRRQKVFGQALPALRRGEVPPLSSKLSRELFMKLRDESSTVYQEKNYLYAAQLYSLGLMVAYQLKDSDVLIAPRDFSFMHSARAACLIKIEETDAVVADCDQALGMDPNNTEAYRLKVEAMMSEQKYHEAVIIAEQGARRVKILCKLKKDLNDRLQGSSTCSDDQQQKTEEQLRLMPTPQDFKQLLTKNRNLLLQSLTHVNEIVDMLQEHRIFSESAVAKMNAKTKTKEDKIRWILEALSRCSLLGYAILVRMLELTNQHELFAKLNTNGLFLSGIQLQRPYQKKLVVFNKTKIKHIKEEKKIRDTDYIQLNMHTGPSQHLSFERRGIKEVNMNEKHTIKVNLEDLFAKTIKGTKEKEEPRLVLILGIPGSGKSHTCLHIVDQANEGNWKYPNSVPFVFCLRDITKHTTSLKTFLLGKCGPQCNHNEIWKTLMEDDNFFVIIDGLDEDPLDCLSETKQITNPEQKASIGIILSNLIKGFLLPRAKILLTSRVYSAVKVLSFTQRIFELGGIPTEKLWKLFQAELSEDKYKLARELLLSDDLLALAKVPVHAFGLIDFFECMDRGTIETQTELLFSITIAKIVKTDRQKKTKNFTDLIQVIQHRAKELRQIANLGIASFKTEQTAMAFTRAELDRHDVTDAAIECGIFTAYISSLRHIFGKRNEEKYHVPHLATFELLAGLGNTQENVKCLRSLVRRNNGQLDMVILYTAGFLCNPSFRPVLLQIFPETTYDCYIQKAEELMKAVISSSRRHTLSGELFVIHTIAESQQWHLAPDVQWSLTGEAIDTSVAVDRQSSRKAIKEVAEIQCDELLLTVRGKKMPTVARKRKMSSPALTKPIKNRAIGSPKYMLSSYAPLPAQPTKTLSSEFPGTSTTKNTPTMTQTRGKSCTAVTKQKTVNLSKQMPSSSAPQPTQLGGSLILTRPHLNAGDSIALGKLLTHTATPYSRVFVWGDIGINGLSRLAASAPCVTVAGTPISAVDLQQSHGQLTGLHGLGMWRADISRYTLPVIAPALAELNDVEAVDLSANPLGVGSEGNIQQTAATSSLGVISHRHRYLRLWQCDLTNTDISALLSGSTRPASLLHLDITRNKLLGVDELAAYMARPHTVLQGLAMKGCGVGDTCMPLIQALQANREIRCLDLSYNEGIPAGVCEMLGALLSSPDTVLNELHVAGCDLDVSALLYPITLPKALPHVTSLDLSNNDTARHAIAQLCQIMKCTRATSPLRFLSLDESGLQDNHLDQLTRALSDVSSKLTTLNVSDNTDLTISAIDSFINNTRLDQLWVADCRLSSDDYVQLFTAISRTDCSIKWLATGEIGVPVDLLSGLQQLTRPLDKLMLFCDESQRGVVGECVERVQERLGAPGMIICCSYKYTWNLYKAESGAYYRHLPPHAWATMTPHPGWHDW